MKTIDLNEATKLKTIINIKLKEWPLVWQKQFFKSYPRFSKVNLKEPKPENYLEQCIAKRESLRNFRCKQISLSKLSRLLKFSAGIVNPKHRAYPSAGARYPLEVYLILNGCPKRGVYHYNVKSHCLELLIPGNFSKFIQKITTQDFLKKASAIMLISAVFPRSEIKYGTRSYRYMLFEAGHLAQNVHLLATSMGLKCCAIGGFIDSELDKLLDLDKRESVIYMIGLDSKV